MMEDRVERERKTLKLLASGVLSKPKQIIDPQRMRTADAERRLESAVGNLFDRKRAALASECARLEALNPVGVLSRGYAVVDNGEGTVTRAAEIAVGDRLKIRFADGCVNAVATERE